MQSAPALANLLGEEIEDPDREYNNNRLDTPRGHDKEISEAEELRQELSAVKKDRAELIHSLAHIKTNLVGTGGGEAQRSQIQQLEHELEIKKLTLNELRTSSKKLVKRTADVTTGISDAKLLTPKGYENEIMTIKQLMGDISRLEEDLIEAEAKNRYNSPFSWSSCLVRSSSEFSDPVLFLMFKTPGCEGFTTFWGRGRGTTT